MLLSFYCFLFVISVGTGCVIRTYLWLHFADSYTLQQRSINIDPQKSISWNIEEINHFTFYYCLYPVLLVGHQSHQWCSSIHNIYAVRFCHLQPHSICSINTPIKCVVATGKQQVVLRDVFAEKKFKSIEFTSSSLKYCGMHKTHTTGHRFLPLTLIYWSISCIRLRNPFDDYVNCANQLWCKQSDAVAVKQRGSHISKYRKPKGEKTHRIKTNRPILLQCSHSLSHCFAVACRPRQAKRTFPNRLIDDQISALFADFPKGVCICA